MKFIPAAFAGLWNMEINTNAPGNTKVCKKISLKNRKKRMKIDLIIKNGRIVTSNSIINAGLAIDNGKFVAIGIEGILPEAERVIDVEGNYILPGIIDEHMHILDMDSANELENFTTATASAAIGGVTTVFEMPISEPMITTIENFKAKKKAGMQKSIVDFALYGGAVPGNHEEMKKMVDAGAIGFKAMMSGSIPGFESLDDGQLYEAFMVTAECDSIITVHAENDSLIRIIEDKLKAEGRKDIWAFFESRSILQEVEAISRAALLAEAAGCHLHVVHVSCSEGIEIIHKRNMRGQMISSETGPHYLTLSYKEDVERLCGYAKFTPPLRSDEERAKLWKQLSDGKIHALGSDHGPHSKENKEKGFENIWEVGNGILAVEAALPVMLSEGVNKGRITIQKLVEVYSENPAKLFGIYPRKGTIQVGSDADLVVVDMDKRWTIEADKFQCLHKQSAYDGMEVKGKPVMTIVRGEIVAEDSKVVGKPGFGRFITRST